MKRAQNENSEHISSIQEAVGRDIEKKTCTPVIRKCDHKEAVGRDNLLKKSRQSQCDHKNPSEIQRTLQQVCSHSRRSEIPFCQPQRYNTDPQTNTTRTIHMECITPKREHEFTQKRELPRHAATLPTPDCHLHCVPVHSLGWFVQHAPHQ